MRNNTKITLISPNAPAELVSVRCRFGHGTVGRWGLFKESEMNNPTLQMLTGEIQDNQLNDCLCELSRLRQDAVDYIEQHTKSCIECGENFVDPGFDEICNSCISHFYKEGSK